MEKSFEHQLEEAINKEMGIQDERIVLSRDSNGKYAFDTYQLREGDKKYTHYRVSEAEMRFGVDDAAGKFGHASNIFLGGISGGAVGKAYWELRGKKVPALKGKQPLVIGSAIAAAIAGSYMGDMLFGGSKKMANSVLDETINELQKTNGIAPPDDLVKSGPPKKYVDLMRDQGQTLSFADQEKIRTLEEAPSVSR